MPKMIVRVSEAIPGSFCDIRRIRRASSLVSSLAAMSALPPKADIEQKQAIPTYSRCFFACCRSLMSINMFTAPTRIPEASYSGVGNGMYGTRVPSGRSATA
jgi:hypothetical protein